MKTKPPESALITFIEKKYPEYYGKICELREAIEGWLDYIPHSFPHYTRHTITHSDTIVSQISKLLFHDDNPEPTVNLSGVEAYILVASAYLHDAGMVTPDREKAAILESEEWKRWTTDGGASERWSEIQKFRQQPDSAGLDAAKRNFLADIQTRFLIAEFIRARHHLRAADVIEVHHDELGRIDFGDHMLREAIAQVCVGHGLRQHELEDNERFPDRWDIREETVNLRFLAILLRLGDLLDMSVDRACPLLLNAASPLPPDSLAHWSQYQAIKRRETSPQKIGVLAECSNQEEHRVLQDWCQWIVDEIHNAKIVIPKCGRHHDWEVPEAVMESESPTIKIRPAKGANYIPSKWNLKFDQYSVFELLSKDLYQEPMVFVRELIQNGLDAMRCKMYADLEAEGEETPEYPTQVPESFRNRYSLKISISEREVQNQLSEKTETKQVIVIEDNGIGMDEEIIEKYFLQVGRSFYQSEEFRRSFRFVPTSRFGIGFLSVFAASDFVTVETYKPSSQIENNTPVRITLTGLKNYLLREKSDKKNAGTRIEIVLRENIEQGKLTELVSDWCKRVEFAINVNDFGDEKMILKEKPEDIVFEQELIGIPNAKVILRSFPINQSGIEGEIYILAYIDENGEFWTKNSWLYREYSFINPLAKLINLPKYLECFHGIVIFKDTLSGASENLSWRLDLRNIKYNPALSRDKRLVKSIVDFPEIESICEEILDKHIDSIKLEKHDLWKYKHDLANSIALQKYWVAEPEMLPIYSDKGVNYISLNELLKINKIQVVISLKKYFSLKTIKANIDQDETVLSNSDFSYFSEDFIYKIFSKFNSLIDVQFISEDCIKLTWSDCGKDNHILYEDKNDYVFLCLYSFPFPDEKLVSIFIHKTFGYESQILNSNNSFVKWLQRFKEACMNELYDLRGEHYSRLVHIIPNQENFEYGIKEFNEYLTKLINHPRLPDELKPPNIEFTPEMWGIKSKIDEEN